jgi:hypothetical protein
MRKRRECPGMACALQLADEEEEEETEKADEKNMTKISKMSRRLWTKMNLSI